VVREVIRLQVAEELDHRRVRAFEVAATQGGVLSAAQEVLGLRLEVFDTHPVVRGEHAAREHLHPRFVAGVVLVHDGSQPCVVAFLRRLPGLLLAKLGLRLGHRGEAAQDEIELDHRLLAPQVPGSNVAMRSSGRRA
jgi:hypothetical protein